MGNRVGTQKAVKSLSNVKKGEKKKNTKKAGEHREDEAVDVDVDDDERENGSQSTYEPEHLSEANRFAAVVKNVLQKSRVKVVEKLVPDTLLDYIEEQQLFKERTHVIMRDVREAKHTTSKNRDIHDLFFRRPMEYISLKRGLGLTGQNVLLADLETLEMMEHNALEEQCSCTSTATCSLLRQLQHRKIQVYTSVNKRVQDIQHKLVDIYRETCSWENPVMMDEIVDPHMSMYVRPAVKFIKEKNCYGEFTERQDQQSKTPKLSYQKIFSATEAGTCKNVYITGDAGTGKTTFCNKLVLEWCSAVQNRKGSSMFDENQIVLSEFKLLFYIILRNFETTYHVKDMIKEQIFQDENDPNDTDVSNLLQTENCLVVIDGLDEWSCPDGVKKLLV